MASGVPLNQAENVYTGKGMTKEEGFYPTYAEWAAQGNREQITQASASVTSNTEFYTIPENKILFITSAFLSAIHDGAGAGGSSSSLRIKSRDILLGVALNTGIQTTQNQTLNFNMPIVAYPGDIIMVTAHASTTARAGFSGYLEDKQI